MDRCTKLEEGRLGLTDDVERSADPAYWYRFEIRKYAPFTDEFGETGHGWGHMEVVENRFSVVRLTPKGAWLDLGFGDERFVLFTGRKRYAHETPAAAKAALVARKTAELRIYRNRVQLTERALRLAEEHQAKERP